MQKKGTSIRKKPVAKKPTRIAHKVKARSMKGKIEQQHAATRRHLATSTKVARALMRHNEKVSRQFSKTPAKPRTRTMRLV